ncbi:hypothetical protein TanjilG_17670 [Lupinus angustifolius]|uniref:Uncharacterized protein n=2 Tax=Lupinus angustifolius TaxID=3871 RepID=A0A1J7H0B1_LUPAN|nr:hypothetical protein TanjilG_17669 [Lupinus angustifolius]OIW06296.1 hypothetical protein TanjilG_17670 [Lupinus angustifolius]
MCTSPNVNEEYHEAFRTKSYIEICNKAQGHLGKTIRLSSPSSSSSTSSTSSSLPFHMHLTEHLLEPRQEIMTNMTQSYKVHILLVDYFEATLEASLFCDKILEGINSMRLSNRRITRVVMLSKRVHDGANENDQNFKDIYKELTSFAMQKNPFYIISTIQFHEIHDQYIELLHRLKSKRRRIRRTISLKRVCKRLGGVVLVTSHCAILVTLLVFSFHSIVGLVAAPAIVGGLVGLFMKRIKMKNENFSTTSYCERLCDQLDVSTKGIYILINDLDTMSRMVKRLHDEVEHRKMIADVCVKNIMKSEILKQVMKDFHEHESSFLDQLEELEEHVYLCFLTINRSRTLVMQKITEKENIGL